MQKTTAATVDAYLAELPAKVQSVLSKVRKAILSAAPEAAESIGYNMPFYRYHGHLVSFSAFTNHCSLFVMSYAIMKKFSKELKPFDTSGATIRFSLDKPLPVTLIKKIVAARITENEHSVAKHETKKSSPKTVTKKIKAAKKKIAKKKKSIQIKKIFLFFKLLKTLGMKKTKTLYRIFTGLFAFLMLGSAIPNIISDPVSVEGFEKMNMPAYLLPFLGIAKALGVIAILIPGYPRIKEWAYAGLIFDLLGGGWCIYASGQPVQSWAFMPIPIALGFISYALYHKKIKITDAQKAKSSLAAFSPA